MKVFASTLVYCSITVAKLVLSLLQLVLLVVVIGVGVAVVIVAVGMGVVALVTVIVVVVVIAVVGYRILLLLEASWCSYCLSCPWLSYQYPVPAAEVTRIIFVVPLEPQGSPAVTVNISHTGSAKPNSLTLQHILSISVLILNSP